MKHLRRWGAIYLLLALFLGSWSGQLLTQIVELKQEAEQHGQAFHLSDLWAPFFSATFENWQSEWLQLIVQGAVLLGMKHLIFKADAEDTELMQAKLNALLDHAGIDRKNIVRDVKAKEATSKTVE